MLYEHEQRPFPNVVTIVFVIVLACLLWYAGGIALALSGAGLVAIGLSLAVLRTSVNDASFSYSYMYVFGGSIACNNIAAVERTSVTIFDGSGMHWLPWRGWVYSIWPGDAVLVRKRSGGHVIVGSNDCDRLYAALVAAAR